jgi:fatty-acyl-CoA synthase
VNVPLSKSYWPAAEGRARSETSIGEALIAAASRWPERVALIEGGIEEPRSWTFAELCDIASQVARALLTDYSPGDRVAVWATNKPEWLFLQFGGALAGVTLVTVNPAFGQSELTYVLGQSRASGLFFEPRVRSRDLLALAAAAASTLPTLRTTVSFDNWDEFLRKSESGPADLPQVRPDDPAQIQYTSGTTGFPKGALLAHRGLVLNGRLYAETIGARPGDVWINPMPLFHTAGCGLVTLGALQTGGTQVLPTAFDPDLMLDLFEARQGTVLLSVPTMLIRMLEAQQQRSRQIQSWRLATLGGAPVPPELVRRAEEQLGVTVAIGFGQTETSPYITHTLPQDPNPNWAQTVGRPLPSVEVKIADPSTGKPVATGVQGEICTRSDCVMIEYFDDPEATQRAIDGERWLHTGDVGTMDSQGYLRVEGRLKDLIIRGGENIYPREVEDVLFTHGAISNVSVVGLPDDEWGEIVAAFVLPRTGAEVGAAELEMFCRSRIASFKVPRQWIFLSEFPQTSSGKVQKFVLRDRYLAEHA